MFLQKNYILKPVYEEFKKYVGNDIGKELEKAEEVDFDLPPEL